MLPRDRVAYRVETDTSDYTIGRVLSLEDQGRWQPVMYYLKTLNDAETRYSTYDKELLAIL